jgi:hypothetical protein
MNIKKFKLSDLKPAPYNPRQISDEALAGLSESLKKFGVLSPVVVNLNSGKPVIISGHQRVKALELQGAENVDCIIVDFDPLTEKAANIALNAETISGDWVVDQLEPLLAELEEELEDFQDLNFDHLAEELDIELPSIDVVNNDTEDEIPEVEQNIVIKKGDLIELGGHRVLCGDSTRAEDVERLMGGEKVDMVFTDPPYGIDVVQGNQVGGGGDPNKGGYAFGGVKNTEKIGGGNIRPSKTYKKIEGDQTTEIAKNFYQCCLDLGFEYMVLWGGNYFTDFLPPSRCWIIWDKEMTGNFSEAEMAWTSFEKGGIRLFKFLWNGLSREGSRDEELKSRVHPTQKPVGLFVNIFERFEEFKIVFDGFLGSGSTLIACEKTGRRCFGMEIDPHYCQVIIQRWCDVTNQDQIKINGNEVSWNEYKSQ